VFLQRFYVLSPSQSGLSSSNSSLSRSSGHQIVFLLHTIQHTHAPQMHMICQIKCVFTKIYFNRFPKGGTSRRPLVYIYTMFLCEARSTWFIILCSLFFKSQDSRPPYLFETCLQAGSTCIILLGDSILRVFLVRMDTSRIRPKIQTKTSWLGAPCGAHASISQIIYNTKIEKCWCKRSKDSRHLPVLF
jgi:hypothetical protein